MTAWWVTSRSGHGVTASAITARPLRVSWYLGHPETIPLGLTYSQVTRHPDRRTARDAWCVRCTTSAWICTKPSSHFTLLIHAHCPAHADSPQPLVALPSRPSAEVMTAGAASS